MGLKAIRWPVRGKSGLYDHFKGVQTVHEERITDLTGRLTNELNSNSSKENKIKFMEANIVSIKENTEKSKENHKVKIKVLLKKI